MNRMHQQEVDWGRQRISAAWWMVVTIWLSTAGISNTSAQSLTNAASSNRYGSSSYRAYDHETGRVLLGVEWGGGWGRMQTNENAQPTLEINASIKHLAAASPLLLELRGGVTNMGLFFVSTTAFSVTPGIGVALRGGYANLVTTADIGPGVRIRERCPFLDDGGCKYTPAVWVLAGSATLELLFCRASRPGAYWRIYVRGQTFAFQDYAAIMGGGGGYAF